MAIRIFQAEPPFIWSIRFSENGRYFAVGFWQHAACVYAVEEGYRLLSQIPMSARVYTVALSADGGHLAVGDRDKHVTLYDTKHVAREKAAMEGGEAELEGGRFLLLATGARSFEVLTSYLWAINL